MFYILKVYSLIPIYIINNKCILKFNLCRWDCLSFVYKIKFHDFACVTSLYYIRYIIFNQNIIVINTCFVQIDNRIYIDWIDYMYYFIIFNL